MTRNDILDMPKSKRRVLLAAQLNLPLFTEFYEKNKVRKRRCKWCKKDIQRIWGHLLDSCENNIVARERKSAGINAGDGSLGEVQMDEIRLFDDERYEQIISFLQGLESASQK